MDIPEYWIHSPGIFPYPGNGDFVVTNRGISLPRELQNYPGIGKNTFPGLFLEVAFVGLK